MSQEICEMEKEIIWGMRKDKVSSFGKDFFPKKPYGKISNAT